MKALVDYYRKYESVTPDFTATVALGAKELLRETFKGRTTTSVVKEVAHGAAAADAPRMKSPCIVRAPARRSTTRASLTLPMSRR